MFEEEPFHSALPPFTFKQESLIPVGVQILPLDFGLQFVLLVWQQVQFDERIRGARKVFGRQFLASENFDSEGGILKTVSNAELDATELFLHWALVVILLRAWRQLQDTERRRSEKPLTVIMS